jgi:hypothetical protein
LRTALICHNEDPLNREGLARWMASFSELTAVISIAEPPGRMKKRVKREIERIGLARFVDVLAFRAYYKLFLAAEDRAWEEKLLGDLKQRYPALASSTRIVDTPSPNTAQCEQALAEARPDIIIARCKQILKKSIFGQARVGTFVMHPGICPEYRNAHGCFWALANRDLERVGMTLLKVDEGVDTGPVYGFYRYPYDEVRESHIQIQGRTVFDNLDLLRAKFEEIVAGGATTIDTTGRHSAVWGQPWLTKYLAWKSAARQRAKG